MRYFSEANSLESEQMAEFSRSRRDALTGAVSLAAASTALGGEHMSAAWSEGEPFQAFEVGAQEGPEEVAARVLDLLRR